MALPKLGVPQYELSLPSTGKTVKYRPFLVKEEKVLLLAMESQEEKQVIDAVKNVLKSCVISRIKVDQLPSFDLEYLFLKIRAAAIGEVIEMTVTCTDDGETNATATINIDEVEVTGSKYLDKESIKNRFFNIQAEEVMQESTLERALLELNDVRGVTARSTLKRGKISGSSDIVLEVEEGRPYYFGMDADNFGSEFTGQARFGTTAIANSLWKFSDEVFLRMVKSDDDQNLLTGYYQLPLDKFGRSTFKVGYHYCPGKVI